MNILFVQTGFIGDVVLSTPVITALKNKFPESKLTLLTTPVASSLVEEHEYLDEVLVFDKRKSQKGISGLRKMASILKEKNFDVVYSCHKSWRTAALLRLTGIPLRYGFREAKAGWWYTKTSPRKDLKHEALRNLAILRNIDLVPEEIATPLKLDISEGCKAAIAQMLSSEADRGFLKRPLVGLAPGSVWATKRWSVEGFVKLSRSLVRQGFGVVLVGGPDDREVGRQIEAGVDEGVINLIGRTTLAESVALIDRCCAMVTNDSAPLHIAGARQVPIVSVFCATVPEFGFGPWMVPHEVVGVEGLACRPCGRHGHQTCPIGTNECQTSLGADVVLDALWRVINASSNDSAKAFVPSHKKHDEVRVGV